MDSPLAAAAEALESAQNVYASAAEKAQAARRDEIGALNRLNSAQKAFDEIVRGMRDAAPSGSDWKSRRRQQEDHLAHT